MVLVRWETSPPLLLCCWLSQREPKSNQAQWPQDVASDLPRRCFSNLYRLHKANQDATAPVEGLHQESEWQQVSSEDDHAPHHHGEQQLGVTPLSKHGYEVIATGNGDIQPCNAVCAAIRQEDVGETAKRGDGREDDQKD